MFGRLISSSRTNGQPVERQAAKPRRRLEEWRPAPLLCKRLDVPDPFRGRPAELRMSQFKTDYLALPDTAAEAEARQPLPQALMVGLPLPPAPAPAPAPAQSPQQVRVFAHRLARVGCMLHSGRNGFRAGPAE
jgi:hypothetical protein